MKAAFRPDVQGLRALAVLLVILSHLPPPLTLAGGFVGVDIFFVISGFVITRVLVRPRAEGATAGGLFVGFMGRRIARLVPALFVVIVATLAASVLFAPTTDLRQIAAAGFTAETFTSNAYYTLNFDTYWNPAVLRSPFLHTWSLGVEFQTYLALPLLVLPALGVDTSRRSSRRRALAIVAVSMAASLALFVYLLTLRSTPLHGLDARGLAFYAPVTRFWEFGLGIVPALLAPTSGSQRPRLATTLLAWALIVGGVAYSTHAKGLNLSVVACCAGVAILIVQGGKLLATRPLVWIGDRSYSIYLWHWPLLVVCIWVFPGSSAAVLVAIAASFLVSALTYPLVEERFRRARGSRVRAIAGWSLVLASGTAAAAVAWTIAGAQWYVAKRPIAEVAVLFPGSVVSSADVLGATGTCQKSHLDPQAGPLEIHCKNFPDDRAEVVIIGDSLSYRSLPAVNLAALRHGFNAAMLWSGRCSIEEHSCPKFIYDYLAHTKIAGLIVATNYDRASDRLNGTQVAYGGRIPCPPNVRTQDCPLHLEEIQKYVVDAAAGIKQLEGYADRILVSLPFPQQAKLVPQCLNLPLFYRFGTRAYDGEGCGQTSLAWQRARQGLYPESMRKVTANDPKVMVWDPTDYLCHDGWCPAVINNGEKIMDDGIHWTWAASRYFYPAFEAFLDRRDSAPGARATATQAALLDP